MRRVEREAGVVWAFSRASLPRTMSSIRGQLFIGGFGVVSGVEVRLVLGVGVGTAQAMRSDSWAEAESRPWSRGMPMMSFRPWVRAAGAMWWRAEQSME